LGTTYIYDLDGTFYPYPKGYPMVCARTVADVAMNTFKVRADFETLALEIDDYYVRHRTWLPLLRDKYGIDPAALHFHYHAALDPAEIPQNPELAQVFKRAAHAHHAILTHASQLWAKRMVGHFNLHAHFPQDNIFSLEHFKELKEHGSAGLRMAMNGLGETNPGNIVFVEDTLLNLIPAKKMGIRTVFIGNPNLVSADKRLHADHIVPSLVDFMKDEFRNSPAFKVG